MTAAGAITVLCGVLLAACSGIGPATVARDRFDYTTAVGESWKNQMLLNLVKIRYGDTPVFLDVASIINQYALETTLTAAGSINNVNGIVPGVPDSSVSLGGQGRWTDRPTITYSPLVGEKFARSLMTPIPPPSLMSLVQAGYPIDLVFRLAVHVVNGIHNRYGGGARARPADPEFYELLERLRRIQIAGVIGMRVRKTDRDEAILMSFRQRIDPAVEADSLAVRQMLGVDPRAKEVRIVYGSVAENDKEVAILSRSVLEILVDLASYIAVPESHVAERRVGETPEPEAGSSGPIPPLMRILSGTARPSDAFIAVPYRDHWYWIEDRDLPSKRLFTFLMFVFTLVETGGKEGAPIVTIPAG
jgi:hypothetical protein